MRIHARSRRLFTLQRIPRGESRTLTVGADVTARQVHWTPYGARCCQNPGWDEGHRNSAPFVDERGELRLCQYCADPASSAARDQIYCAVWPAEARAPRLWICSPLSVSWANDLSDLEHTEIVWTRAKGNNLLRSELLGPAQFPTPPAPLDEWLSTLLQCDKGGAA